jgi:hypothetical protein
VILRLNQGAVLHMLDDRLDNTHVLIEKGSALVEVVSKPKNTPTWVHLGDTVTQLRKAGLYRFDAGWNASAGELRVHRGEAWVWRDEAAPPVKAKRGWTVDLNNADLRLRKFDTKASDQFHRWAAGRSFQLFYISRETGTNVNYWYARSQGRVWNDSYQVELPGTLPSTARNSLVNIPERLGQPSQRSIMRR